MDLQHSLKPGKTEVSFNPEEIRFVGPGLNLLQMSGLVLRTLVADLRDAWPVVVTFRDGAIVRMAEADNAPRSLGAYVRRVLEP